jgi:predicted PurR-regulated permease PerM
MSESQPVSQSPNWSTNTKLIIGLTIVAVIAFILAQVRGIIGSLIVSFMLAYLLHPIVSFLNRKTRLSWRAASTLVFLVVVIIIFGLLTATGVAVVGQFQNLIAVVQQFITDLPTIVEDLIDQGMVISIPYIDYEFDLGEYVSQLNIDLLALSNQLLSVLQPLLGQAGSVLATVASSAFGVITGLFFILIIAYFILAETGKGIFSLEGFEATSFIHDLKRMGKEISYIWNAFLRGQFVIFIISVILYLILLSVLGVRNVLALAFISGLAKFVPYIGPFITAITTAIVAFFQPENYFGMEPYAFGLLVVILAVLLDQIFDGFVSPRIMGTSLGVHPAAVLVSAIIAAQMIGIVGLLLAAPVFATLQLITRYTIRKMLDQDPWPDPEPGEVDIDFPLEKNLRQAWYKLKSFFKKIKFPKSK